MDSLSNVAGQTRSSLAWLDNIVLVVVSIQDQGEAMKPVKPSKAMTWPLAARQALMEQQAENERLRKVVDAVERHYDAETTEPGGRESDRTLVEMFRAVDALRELEDSDE
jgi:hypothetical protein